MRRFMGVRDAAWLVTIVLISGCGDDRDEDSGETGDGGPPVCTVCGACEEIVAVKSASHVPGPIDYPDPPPAGGDHDPCWTTWGPHPDLVPAANWVHNLEHGGVAFLYQCPDGCEEHAADIEALSIFASEVPQAILTSYDAMPKPFAVVSWGHRLVSECFDVSAALRFYARHVGDAPEGFLTANPPADCQ